MPDESDVAVATRPPAPTRSWFVRWRDSRFYVGPRGSGRVVVLPRKRMDVMDAVDRIEEALENLNTRKLERDGPSLTFGRIIGRFGALQWFGGIRSGTLTAERNGDQIEVVYEVEFGHLFAGLTMPPIALAMAVSSGVPATALTIGAFAALWIGGTWGPYYQGVRGIAKLIREATNQPSRRHSRWRPW